MSIVDPALGLCVIVLGSLLIVGGIIVAAVVYRYGREIKGMIMPLFDMDFQSFLPAESPASGLVPLITGYTTGFLKRVFTYVDVVGLVGGAAVSIVGVIVVLMGVYIYV